MYPDSFQPSDENNIHKEKLQSGEKGILSNLFPQIETL